MRHDKMAGALLLAWASSATAPQLGAQSHTPTAHVRADGRQQQLLLGDAMKRSPTFQELVRRLERSSIVVYVTFGVCPGRVKACLTYVTTAAQLTYVRATVDPFDCSRSAQAGLLGHELLHALELTDARVESLEDFRTFYERHGRHGSIGFETDDAAATGRRVEREFETSR